MGFIQRLFKPSHFLFSMLCLVLCINTASAAQKILVWGDSLSAAYGIPVEKGWVNLMRQKLGDNIEIINGSISGETTQGGLTRLPDALKRYQPDLLILELGANDGLRGVPPRVTKKNLKKIIESTLKTNARVVLLGMKIPPNYGETYSQKFERVFADLAAEYKLPFIPFFLEDIITKRELLQSDELHPTAEAQPILLKKILPILKAEIKKPA